jgi:hypothetical protein
MTRTALKGPSVGMSAANEPNPARLAAELQAITLALRIGGLDGLRSGQVSLVLDHRRQECRDQAANR